MCHFHLQPNRLENRARQPPLPELSSGAFASKRETGSDYPEDQPPSAGGVERSRAYVTLLKLFSITSGCLNTLHRPDNTTTPGQMGGFINRSIVGDNLTFPLDPYLTHLPASNTYLSTQRMRQLGITSGCTTTQYCPDNPVTRGQVAVFVVRAKLQVATLRNFSYNPDILLHCSAVHPPLLRFHSEVEGSGDHRGVFSDT